MLNKNSQLKESKAFLKSKVVIRPGILWSFVYSITSLIDLTASKMVLPFTYAHWLSCIISGRIFSSLVAKAFDPIRISVSSFPRTFYLCLSFQLMEYRIYSCISRPFMTKKSAQKIALDLYTSHTQRSDQAVREISITTA